MEWEELREKIIWRDGGKCFVCGSRKELSAHHIVAREKGGEDVARNLITLCEKCHNYIEDEDWIFILKTKEMKMEEIRIKYNKKDLKKYGKKIDMYKLVGRGKDRGLLKIGERYELW